MKVSVLLLLIILITNFITEDIYELLKKFWGVFIRIYEHDGLLSALLSGRDNLVENRFWLLVTKYWGNPNYLFGGHDLVSFYNELAFHDLFLMFGILGSPIYLLLFFRYVFYIKVFNTFTMFIFLMVLIIASTSGHFFESAMNALYLSFFSLYSSNFKLNEIET